MTKKFLLVIIFAIALLLVSCELEPPHTHVWDAGVVTTQSTCATTGLKTYTCTDCSETKTETVPASGHTWDDGEVTTVSTCEATGIKTYTCIVCSETKTEETPAIGHNYGDWIGEILATVSKTGTKGHYHCSVCGKNYDQNYAEIVDLVIPFLIPSEGLKFTSNKNGTCAAAGIGTCTDTDVVIPETSPQGDRVTSIGNKAFYGCTELTSITIPSSVTSIGDSAFSNCSTIMDITIPDSVTNIGNWAFYNCTSLMIIQVSPKNPVYYSTGNCLIETASKTLIAGCKNSVISADGSVTNIGSEAFAGCSGLTNITIPDSITSIGEYAFDGCSGLTNITIPDSITSIGEHAFSACWGLTSITIPSSVTSIEYSTFSNCRGLTSIIIPDGVTSIGNSAFGQCTSLTSITIPNSVTSIGYLVFEGCRNIESITVVEGNPIYHSSGNCLIETASKTLITGCKNSVIPSDGSVRSILRDAFSGCTSLTSITIPNSITSIGEHAFFMCTSLTSITYNGTKAQWDAIQKRYFWNSSTGNYTIHCTDGDIAK